MTSTTFSLQPFSSGEAVPEINITGHIQRSESNQLSITYEVGGAIESVKFADPVATPTRRWELWETTCFEFFVGIPGQKNYWEFNLAPNGNWNVFGLNNYRESIHEATSVQHLNILTKQSADRFSLSLDIPLAVLMPIDQPLEISVTAVIEDQSDEITYWAVTHAADEPDFHHRGSFSIHL